MKAEIKKNKVVTALKIIVSLFFIAMFVSSLLSVDVDTGNVALINLVNQIKQANDNTQIKVIVLDINSPGGSGVAADEIASAIKNSKKPVVAVVREVGASAAYWIASASDYIYANRVSFTGSIGVIGSYLDFSGLLKEYNVTYQRFVSGQFKDLGTPFKETTEEERVLFQGLIDDVEDIFVAEVAVNRGLSYEAVDNISTGQVFLAHQSKELGLIDFIGTKEDALSFIAEEYNLTVDILEYKEDVSFVDLLSTLSYQGGIATFINPVPSMLKLR